ncbi:hypothetical protein [Nocardia sp. NPDC059228]|uniref:hypothetical protein n=1 Tax=Nocardia sp. NPDC059228 TaxID=3346777 RepID=UPI0036A77815
MTHGTGAFLNCSECELGACLFVGDLETRGSLGQLNRSVLPMLPVVFTGLHRDHTDPVPPVEPYRQIYRFVDDLVCAVGQLSHGLVLTVVSAPPPSFEPSVTLR